MAGGTIGIRIAKQANVSLSHDIEKSKSSLPAYH
jgi:hypothetical protein